MENLLINLIYYFLVRKTDRCLVTQMLKLFKVRSVSHSIECLLVMSMKPERENICTICLKAHTTRMFTGVLAGRDDDDVNKAADVQKK